MATLEPGGNPPVGLRAADLMTTQVRTVEPEMNLVDLESFLTDQRVSGVPVVSRDRVIGVVSRSDVVRLLAEENERVRSALYFYYYLSPWDEAVAFPDLISSESREVLGRRLESLKVRDAMTSAILSVAPDAPIEELCQEMAAHGVHRMLVVEAEVLRGVISSLDVVRAVAERGLSPT